MTNLTEPSPVPPPATNGALPGALPAEDAAGETVAAIAEADKISAGMRDSIGSRSSANS
jgi:ubiquitin-like 1-activating enzyme E1 A